jgi:diguanylate cyclase (GGDEF)-like protein
VAQPVPPEAGDRALRLFGQAVRTTLRGDDLGGRIGGEEFGLLLRDLTAEETLTVLDRLRATLGTFAGGRTPSFTASFGVCSSSGGESLDELMRTADHALYRAKQEGRNRVVLADDRDRREVPDAPTLESASSWSARHDDLTDPAPLR